MKKMIMMTRRVKIVDVESNKKIKNNLAIGGILLIKGTYRLKGQFLKIRDFFLIRI